MKIQMKIEEHTKLSKLNEKLITLDIQIIQILFPNLKSSNVQNRENSI